MNELRKRKRGFKVETKCKHYNECRLPVQLCNKKCGLFEVEGNIQTPKAEQTTKKQESITIKDPTKIPDYLKL